MAHLVGRIRHSQHVPIAPAADLGKYLGYWEPGQVIPNGMFDHHNGRDTGPKHYFAAIGHLLFLSLSLPVGGIFCVISGFSQYGPSG